MSNREIKRKMSYALSDTIVWESCKCSALHLLIGMRTRDVAHLLLECALAGWDHRTVENKKLEPFIVFSTFFLFLSYIFQQERTFVFAHSRMKMKIYVINQIPESRVLYTYIMPMNSCGVMYSLCRLIRYICRII